MSEPAVTDTLAQLIAFPTVSDRPVTEIAAYLAQRAEDAGFSASQLPSSPGKANVVARAGPRGEGGLVLSGHMDVVPTEGQRWTSDPFKLTERDGNLVGRGTADMKGFLAAVATAVDGMDLTNLQREVVLIWTHDEEVGCLGAQQLVDHWSDTLDPLPPDAWIGEPTDLHVCHMHPGHTTLTIRCTGRPAHSSRPQLGFSAIHLAGEVLEVLREVAASWEKRRSWEDLLPSPHAVMNVGRIEGGRAINIVPDHCVIEVGIRPLPGQDSHALVEEIRCALAPLSEVAMAAGGGLGVSLEQLTPPMLTDPDTPLAKTLCDHAVGQALRGAPFATDGGHLNRLSTRCLIFGPGSIDLAHRPDESIPATALAQTVDIVQRVIRDRCS